MHPRHGPGSRAEAPARDCARALSVRSPDAHRCSAGGRFRISLPRCERVSPARCSRARDRLNASERRPHALRVLHRPVCILGRRSLRRRQQAPPSQSLPGTCGAPVHPIPPIVLSARWAGGKLNLHPGTFEHRRPAPVPSTVCRARPTTRLPAEHLQSSCPSAVDGWARPVTRPPCTARRAYGSRAAPFLVPAWRASSGCLGWHACHPCPLNHVMAPP